MFTTYPSSEITFDPRGKPNASSGQRVWRLVEQELLLPWLYLQVVIKSKSECYASMLMVYHAHELRQFIDAQPRRMWVEQVQLVIPPHMSGNSNWMMEPLAMAGIVEDPRDESHFIVYKTASGTIYTLRDDADATIEPFKILFSSDRDLSRADKNG